MLNRYDKKALIELAKSAGRFLWFGLLGLIVAVLGMVATSGAVNDITLTVAGLTINLGSFILIAVGFAAKAIDKYIHENQNIDSKGIAPAFLQR